ncbi:hypothetical protein Aph01nite_16840 [Acrocarpospora phusangensis]|uniref:FAD-binding FR-type domain-containing protein n=1 Tax=Acrocarpospora phusangensis TaxID=1070424 RepID=A0A919UIS1_9ACTN|nr:siderophore-interacting protein [Acrocarpospora phusangensis]GIH23374.1 hypothetical protein Aph01nite_16840 [Acrocarpospora phusangensis]
MPTVPALIADPMTRWMGRRAVAATVAAISPGLVRVRFEGEDLKGRNWLPGCEIEFRVGRRDLRHYTTAAFDDDAGWIEVLFQLHGGGPGSTWARGLTPGDEVLVLGPGTKPWLRKGTSHFMAGDASALGLFEALTAGLGTGARAVGAVEVPPADVAAARELVPRLHVVAARDRPGEALVGWVAEMEGERPDVAYLAGHARTIQAVRGLLCAERVGMRRRDVVTKPYWADGKRGL